MSNHQDKFREDALPSNSFTAADQANIYIPPGATISDSLTYKAPMEDKQKAPKDVEREKLFIPVKEKCDHPKGYCKDGYDICGECGTRVGGNGIISDSNKLESSQKVGWEKELQAIYERDFTPKTHMSPMRTSIGKARFMVLTNFISDLLSHSSTQLLEELDREVEKLRTTEVPNVPQGYPKLIGYNRALDDIQTLLREYKQK